MVKKKKEQLDWTQKYNKALQDWGNLNKEAQLSSIITVFLWFWYVFMGRKNIEIWKVVLVNIILVFGIATSTRKRKKGDKHGKDK